MLRCYVVYDVNIKYHSVVQGTAVAQWLQIGRSLVRSQLVSMDFSLT